MFGALTLGVERFGTIIGTIFDLLSTRNRTVML